MTNFEAERERIKARNNAHRAGWRFGWIACGNGEEPKPDTDRCNEPGYTDGYYAGYDARARIARYNRS